MRTYLFGKALDEVTTVLGTGSRSTTAAAYLE